MLHFRHNGAPMIEVAEVVFDREYSVYGIWDEIYPLLVQHKDEIAHHKDIPLDPDKDFYMKACALGMVRVFTAREDAKLIGYAIFFVKPDFHYQQLTAQQDIIFIQKDKRGFGRKFIEWCDEQLKAEGVRFVSHHVKKAHDFSPLLRRIGYELVDLIYVRRFF